MWVCKKKIEKQSNENKMRRMNRGSDKMKKSFVRKFLLCLIFCIIIASASVSATVAKAATTTTPSTDSAEVVVDDVVAGGVINSVKVHTHIQSFFIYKCLFCFYKKTKQFINVLSLL